MTGFHCGEPCHISTYYQKWKKVQSGGKVFSLTSSETTSIDKLIRGTCFIYGILLIAIIDIGATHSLILIDYAERLDLMLYSLIGSMVIDTPSTSLVTTSWVCLNCSLTIYCKSFWMDLVCLPLNQLDVILGMNWLEFNHVHITYFDKSVSFP